MEHYGKLEESTERMFGLVQVWIEIHLICILIQAWHAAFLSGEILFWMSEPFCNDDDDDVLQERSSTDANIKALNAWTYMSVF